MSFGVNTLTFGNVNGPSTTFSTIASITPTANAIILIHLESHDSGGNPPDPDSVVGNGINYEKIDGGTVFNGGYATWTYRGMSSSPTSGVITFTWPSARPQDNCAYQVIEITGAITTGTNGSGAIGIHNAAGAFPGTSVSQNLGTLTSGSATVAGCYVHDNFSTITPTSGHTKYGQQNNFSDGNTTTAIMYNLAPSDGVMGFSISGSAVTIGWWGIEILQAGGPTNFPLSLGSGTYTITGTALTITYQSASGNAYTLPLAAGAYTIAGQNVGIEHAVPADVGVYTITGQNVGITWTAASGTPYSVQLGSGTYDIVGNFLLRGVSKVLDPGSYIITGQDITVTQVRTWSTALNSGSYVIVGSSGADRMKIIYDPISGPPIEGGGGSGKGGIPFTRRRRR